MLRLSVAYAATITPPVFLARDEMVVVEDARIFLFRTPVCHAVSRYAASGSRSIAVAVLCWAEDLVWLSRSVRISLL